KALAAASTDYLMKDAKLAEEEATAWVSRKVHNLGYRKDNGTPIEATTVAEWRDNIAYPQRQTVMLILEDLRSRPLKSRDHDDRPIDPVPQRKQHIKALLAEFALFLGSIRNPIKPPV